MSVGREESRELVKRLRQTRVEMIGTQDEQHYWDCQDAAAEIERLLGVIDTYAWSSEAACREINMLKERLARGRIVHVAHTVED